MRVWCLLIWPNALIQDRHADNHECTVILTGGLSSTQKSPHAPLAPFPFALLHSAAKYRGRGSFWAYQKIVSVFIWRIRTHSANAVGVRARISHCCSYFTAACPGRSYLCHPASSAVEDSKLQPNLLWAITPG